MSWPAFVGIAVAAFVVMEPVTAATHRWVMHGFGEFLHRSHHHPRPTRWQRNDWYPVGFAAVVMLGMWAGFNVGNLGALVPVGVGITAYGATYALVHDVYIHQRIGWFGNRRIGVLDRLADAHRIHHLYNGAPFGMLVPIVPAAARERAQRTERNPIRPASA